MNNRGWGLATMLVLCAILAFALIISAIIYEQTFNDALLPEDNTSGQVEGTEEYHTLESQVNDAAITYFEKYYPTLPDGDKVYVSVKKLQVEKMLDTLTDDSGNDCSGYASYQKVDGSAHYQAYIKCGRRYTTSGYRSEFDD